MTKAVSIRLLAYTAPLFVLLAGCGTAANAGAVTNSIQTQTSQTQATSNSPTTKPTNTHGFVVGAAPYQGQANLAKYVRAAQSNPKNTNAQIQAGVAERVNGSDTKAIAYYQAAIKDDPKSGLAYNNLGNIYLRDENNPTQALPYYQKATQVDPSYGYGWWNLAATYQKLGKIATAKQVAQEGIQKISKSDPAYSGIETLLKSLK